MSDDVTNQTNSPELDSLIRHGREERNLEYKGSMHWASPETKAKLAKTAMAMANIPDGGAIVLGVIEESGVFRTDGMADDHFESFSQDDVMERVNEYADPYVELSVSKRVFDKDKKFVVIQVRPFDKIPVVCKKSGQEGLTRGAVFTRSRRKYETAEIGSQSEMRELLNLAVDKEIYDLRRRGILLGHTEVRAEVQDRALFEKQLEDL